MAFCNLESQKLSFQGFSRGIFLCRHHVVLLEYTQDWDNAVKMSQVLHDIVQFERFTDRNLFKYVFIVIQNWETDALQFHLTLLIFC